MSVLPSPGGGPLAPGFEVALTESDLVIRAIDGRKTGIQGRTPAESCRRYGFRPLPEAQSYHRCGSDFHRGRDVHRTALAVQLGVGNNEFVLARFDLRPGPVSLDDVGFKIGRGTWRRIGPRCGAEMRFRSPKVRVWIRPVAGSTQAGCYRCGVRVLEEQAPVPPGDAPAHPENRPFGERCQRL